MFVAHELCIHRQDTRPHHLYLPLGNQSFYILFALLTFIFTVSCQDDLDSAVTVTSIEISKTSLLLKPGETTTLVATVKPNNVPDNIVSWRSSDIAIATVDKTGTVIAVKEGAATITAKAGKCFATCSITVAAENAVPENAVPENAVDLGLSVYWATSNVIEPEAYRYTHTLIYGHYFAWGEVERYCDVAGYGLVFKETKEEYGYSFNSYKYDGGSGNDYHKITKYCPTDKVDFWAGTGSPDNKTVLDPEDDVAHITWGGKWRTPTAAEWTELFTKCSWEWKSRSISGFNAGVIFFTGPNGNSIRLPAGGFIGGKTIVNLDIWGMYMSSSLDIDNPDHALYANFSETSVSLKSWQRSNGVSVRPVMDIPK